MSWAFSKVMFPTLASRAMFQRYFYCPWLQSHMVMFFVLLLISNIPLFAPSSLTFHLTLFVSIPTIYKTLWTYITLNIPDCLSHPSPHPIFLLIKLRFPGLWRWIEHSRSHASWILPGQNTNLSYILLCLFLSETTWQLTVTGDKSTIMLISLILESWWWTSHCP